MKGEQLQVVATTDQSDKGAYIMPLHRLAVIFAFVFLLVGQDGPTQETTESKQLGEKQPWELTIEERLAERYDPSKVEERRLKAAEKELQSNPRRFDRPALHDPSLAFIDGDKTPELILPWELFDSMMHRAFLADSEYSSYFRERIQIRAGSFGKRDDLWPMLEKIGSVFIDLNVEMQAIGGNPAYHNPNSSQYNEVRETYDSLGLQSCRVRFEALNTARAYFGRTLFDRFLYEAVAPEYSVSYDWDGKGKDKIEIKIWVAGGCQ